MDKSTPPIAAVQAAEIAALAFVRWAVMRPTDSDWQPSPTWTVDEVADGEAIRAAATPRTKPTPAAIARAEALFNQPSSRPAPSEKDRGALALFAGKVFRRLDPGLARAAASAWAMTNTGLSAAEIDGVLDWTAARAGARRRA